MLSILQGKSWTCSGNVKVFLEFNDCVQLNQVRISMLHCEMLHYLKRKKASITVWKHRKCLLFLRHILVNKFCKCTSVF